MKNLFLLILLLISYSSFSQVNKTAKWHSPDSSEYHITTTQKINGCDKVTSEKVYNKKGMLLSEWAKKYSTDRNQTCDFSSYIRTEKKYSGKVMIRQAQYMSGCDDCEEQPCGTWYSYDSKGKLIETKELGACSIVYKKQ